VHVSNDDTQRAEPYAALVARRLHPVHGAATNSTCRDLLARLVPPLRAPGARVGRRVAPNRPSGAPDLWFFVHRVHRIADRRRVSPPTSHVRASGARIRASNWRGPSISYQKPSRAAMVRTGSGWSGRNALNQRTTSAEGGSSRNRSTGDQTSHRTPSNGATVTRTSVSRTPITLPSTPPRNAPTGRIP